jgi:hypothetical protein
VWDPGVNTTLVTGFTSTSSGLSGIIGELQSILSYLLGSTTGGNGLVETIASMNDKLAHANATADQNWAMNDTTDRRRRAETIVAQRRIARADDVGGYEATTAAGGRGVGSAATLASKLSIDADIVAKMTENQNGFTEKAEVLNRANYCSAQDVTNKRPGCSAVGQLPSADIELGTLTTLPTKDASTPTDVTLAKLYALSAVDLYPVRHRQVHSARRRACSKPPDQLRTEDAQSLSAMRSASSPAFGATLPVAMTMITPGTMPTQRTGLPLKAMAPMMAMRKIDWELRLGPPESAIGAPSRYRMEDELPTGGGGVASNSLSDCSPFTGVNCLFTSATCIRHSLGGRETGPHCTSRRIRRLLENFEVGIPHRGSPRVAASA